MKKILFAVLLFVTGNLFAQEVIDRVVAVVDDEIILQSEFEYKIPYLASQNNLNTDDPNLPKKVLKVLIDEKLLLAQAHLDSIDISDQDVNARIDYQIDMLTRQYGSIEKIEEIFGKSIEKLKRDWREDAKKNMMVQRLREMKFAGIEASRREVEEFFRKYKDTIGAIPEKVKVSHIYKNPKMTSPLKKKYKELAQTILDSIKAGGDFEDFAKRYSDDKANASEGGDLGWVKKGWFYPEFEAAAYALDEGEISGVVESPVGFHIIQLIEKRGESIHTRHILIRVKADDEADLAAIKFLNKVRDSIINNHGTFDEFARKYSDDKETASFGGELGTFYIDQLQDATKDVVSNLKEGEISFPRRVDRSKEEYGYHIVYLEERIKQHQPDLELDSNDIKPLADEFKKQKLYEEWMAQIRDRIYWEVKVEELKFDE